MNQLNKLIEQYERENPGKKARKDIGHLITIYEDDFVLWLATRPTCGKEQRLFLDEVEKKGILGSVGGIIIKSKSDYKDPIVIEQSEFNADLSKVIKGE